MEIKQLLYFKTIVDHGSISSAAKALNMTQPPLSYQIKQLEQELNTTLFTRGSKTISLTPSGIALYQKSEIILNMTSETIKEITTLKDTPLLRIGITPTTLPVLLPYLTKLKEECPNIHYSIYDGNTFKLTSLLFENVIDIAAIRSPANMNNLNYINIRNEHMILVSSEPFPTNSTTIKDIKKNRLIIYRRYYELINQTFIKYNLQLNPYCECDDARTAIDLVHNGFGQAIFPNSLRSLCKDLYIQDIEEDNLNTSILLVTSKNKPINDVCEKLINIIKE